MIWVYLFLAAIWLELCGVVFWFSRGADGEQKAHIWAARMLLLTPIWPVPLVAIAVTWTIKVLKTVVKAATQKGRLI